MTVTNMNHAFAPLNISQFPRYYLETLSGLLRRPGDFFSGLASGTRPGAPLGFLTASSLLHVLGALTQMDSPHFFPPLLLFLNAMLMPLITAVAGFAAMKAIPGGKADFSRVMSVYVLGSGAVLPFSWVPFFSLLAEIGKWVLIGIGLARTCGFSRGRTLVMIFASIIFVSLGFYALNIALASLKG
ncbi:MAG: hypothetical protein KKB20_21695 [Proteobacteria bacterium]|nr:hypothetical protein [Pseudomonadota bacterium]